MVTWQALFALLLVISSQFMNTRATVILTSTVDGRQAACPGDVVTYTCTVIQGASLTWTAAPVLVDSTILRFLDTSPSGESRNCSDITVPCANLDYQATLTGVSSNTGTVADLTSTFKFTARAELNGTVVQCRAVTAASTPPATQSLNVAGLPSPPRTPSYTVEQYGQDNVMLTVQWQPPQDDGGAAVDNYTITVSPGSTQVTTTATSALLSAVSYNVNHTVGIVASNCNGSSSAVTDTIRIVNCSDPATPGNGFIEPYQNTTEGAEISFRCNSQFVPNTTRMATCGADVRWNPDPATHVCTLDCGPPPAPRNGSLESHTCTSEGSVVFYSCDSGLVPEMRMMSVCTGTGWNPNPSDLSCSAVATDFLPVNCGMPTGARNGSIEPYQSTLGGAEIFFMCAPGFVPAGRMRANCTSDGITVDGIWTPDPATLMCNASTVDCGDPTNTSSEVIVQYSSTIVGSVIFYQCRQSGFAPSSSSAVCMESGRWSPDPSLVVCRMVTTTTTIPTGSIPSSCSTSNAITAVVSCAVSFFTGAVIGAVMHYCAVRKKSKCQKFYSLTIARKQQKRQPAPVYEDIVAREGAVDPTHIELRENIAYGPIKN